MPSPKSSSKLPLIVLVIATSFVTGCKTAGSDSVVVAPACPPVVPYSREYLLRADAEVALLPNNSVLVEMLSDYSVMRDQARACKGESL